MNTLSSLMKSIADSAGLSKPYTAHCVRATVVTELHDAGFPLENIARVTGHKSSTSVEKYIRKGKRREAVIASMSHQLTAALDSGAEAEATASPAAPAEPTGGANGALAAKQISGEGKRLRIRADGDANVVEFFFE